MVHIIVVINLNLQIIAIYISAGVELSIQIFTL